MKKEEKKPAAETEEYEKLQIFPEARIYETKITKKYKNRKVWKKPDFQEIFSIIPGTVAEIKVKIGDHVQKGDQIMVYEAMKMENIIRAPFDGTVEQIFVKEKEKLAKGVLMIYLKSDLEFIAEDYSISNVLDLNG